MNKFYLAFFLGIISSIALSITIAKSAASTNKNSDKIADIRMEGRENPDPNKAILPANFKVNSGFETKTLPTINDFIGSPGCYVACYSREEKNSIYSVGGGIYVMGQVRVPGSYSGRICLPKSYEEADISAEPEFKKLCARSLPQSCEGDSCWAGGDTGGWFGIP